MDRKELNEYVENASLKEVKQFANFLVAEMPNGLIAKLEPYFEKKIKFIGEALPPEMKKSGSNQRKQANDEESDNEDMLEQVKKEEEADDIELPELD